jgi:hypothetical protein
MYLYVESSNILLLFLEANPSSTKKYVEIYSGNEADKEINSPILPFTFPNF